MNFEYGTTPVPIRVLMVNPLAPASQLIMMKILGGEIFGNDKLIDMIFLVYSNEKTEAESLKLLLIECAYICAHTIEISSDLPSISDADVFCFVTHFKNPNHIDFTKIEADEFDSFYLLLKIAHNFSIRPPPVEKPPLDKPRKSLRKPEKVTPKRIKPIFIADGLVAIDILYTFSKHIPRDLFISPTSLPSVAKSVLGDYLKVTLDVLNDVLVWAANDQVFYVGVQTPCILYDPVDQNGPRCAWRMMGKPLREKLELDHTDFNDSWLKKEFLQKVKSIASENPYGSIYTGQTMVKCLQDVWKHRNNEAAKRTSKNYGVISDGTLQTFKDCPYILPMHLDGDKFIVDLRFESSTYLQYEIKKINKEVQEHHRKLVSYCKRFLEENVLKLSFVPPEESSVTFSLNGHNSSGASLAITTTQSKSFAPS